MPRRLALLASTVAILMLVAAPSVRTSFAAATGQLHGYFNAKFQSDPSTCAAIDPSLSEVDLAFGADPVAPGRVYSLSNGVLSALVVVAGVDGDGRVEIVDLVASIGLDATILRTASGATAIQFDPAVRNASHLSANGDALESIALCYAIVIPPPPAPTGPTPTIAPAETAVATTPLPTATATVVVPSPTPTPVSFDLDVVATANAIATAAAITATAVASESAALVATAQAHAAELEATLAAQQSADATRAAAIEAERATATAAAEIAVATVAAQATALTAQQDAIATAEAGALESQNALATAQAEAQLTATAQAAAGATQAASAAAASDSAAATASAQANAIAAAQTEVAAARETVAAIEATTGAAVTATPIPSAGTVIYSASNAAEFSALSLPKGWKIAGDTLIADGSSSGAWVTLPALSVGNDYRIEVDLSISASGECARNAGIGVRGSAEGYFAGGFEWSCDPRAQIWKVGEVLRSDPYVLDENPHTIAVQALGSEISLSVDGTTLSSWSSGDFPAGIPIGIFSNGVKLVVTAIRVVDLGQ